MREFNIKNVNGFELVKEFSKRVVADYYDSFVDENFTLDKEDRINNRIFILSNLDHIIKESVYYRTYSDEINALNKVAAASIYQSDIKVRIL